MKALRIVQGARVMYLTAASVGSILAAAKVATWRPGQPIDDEGYQREVEDTRCRKVARYLQRRDAVLPLSILVNVRPKDGSSPLAFEAGSEGSAWGTLRIPKGVHLWVVDGQHRLCGFKALRAYFNTEKSDFLLPLTIADAFSPYEEMMQFYTINNTAKGVRTDLVRRLMVQMARRPEDHDRLHRDRRLWEARATIVADKLSKRQDSPWHRRIKAPNAPKTGEELIREVTFTNTLKPVFDDGFIRARDDDQVVELLTRFWNALRELMPEAFLKPENCILQKTPGLYIMHLLAPHVFERCRLLNDYSVERMAELLRHLPSDALDSDAWTGTGKYSVVGGLKGFRTEAEALIDALPETDELAEVNL